jgi:3-oxoacyl-[acyl-carrier-protein] synthase II
MSRRVVITGVGPISGLGIGIEPTWAAVCAGQSAIRRIEAFDPSGFACPWGAEVPTFKINDYVPKSYRKATKVMARDIQLAVVAANQAAQDAKLATKSADAENGKGEAFQSTYEPARMGCHIGAGLIAADLDELAGALVEARVAEGPAAQDFDIHKWGSEGMTHLTPLWLLKYLPNMLACHVTIIHDAQGPSNTITCGEASSGLSIGESLRVIQRHHADLCFCGGAESKLNPMAFLRQQLAGRLTSNGTSDAGKAVRPFDQSASGMVIGEGGGIVILEALDTFESRKMGQAGLRAYAEVAGFAASQTVNREARNLQPEPAGRSIAVALRNAMREANVQASEIDLIVAQGTAAPAWDQAEAAAMRSIFGDRLGEIPVAATKAMTGNCGAGAGGLEVAIAAKAVAEQTLPAIINRATPLQGLKGESPCGKAELRHALVFSTGYGGQNTALVLKRI